MILLTRDLGLVWLPHIPSWTSSRIYLASSSLTHFRLCIKNPLLYKASFRIVNPASLFLIFQASSTSVGSHSYLRKDRIGAVQPFWLWTLRVWNYSMLGYFWTSTFRFGGMDHSFDMLALLLRLLPSFGSWGSMWILPDQILEPSAPTAWVIFASYPPLLYIHPLSFRSPIWNYFGGVGFWHPMLSWL